MILDKTLYVNLFGGPGISKSTTAAGVFCLLKLHGIDCELIPEFAKDLVWEKRENTLQNQQYIFGKQYHRFWRLNNQVDVVISDSPLLLSCIYGEDDDVDFQRNVINETNKFSNINYLLRRVKPYNPNGRYQNEEGAKLVDIKVKEFLLKNSNFVELPGDFRAVNKITTNILKTYFNKDMIVHLYAY